MPDISKQWSGTAEALQRSLADSPEQAAFAAELWDAMTKAVDADHLEAICAMARERVRKLSRRNQSRLSEYKLALLSYFKEQPVNATIMKRLSGLKWQPEYRFHKTRRWRFDWACESLMVAIEIEGGAYARGRHTRGSGFIGDMEKYNAAGVAGWTVLRYTPQQFSGLAWLPDVEAINKRMKGSAT